MKKRIAKRKAKRVRLERPHTQVFSLRLPIEDLYRLKDIAKAQRRTLSNLVIVYVAEGLERDYPTQEKKSA